MKGLNGKVSDLEKAAAQRKAKLDENSAFLQFNWKADVVESWIGEHCLAGPTFPAQPAGLPRAQGASTPFAVRFLLQRSWSRGQRARHQGTPLAAAEGASVLTQSPKASVSSTGPHTGS